MADSGPAVPAAAARRAAMGSVEFVAFAAVALIIGAVGVDLMVPALRSIHDDFGLDNANLSQAVLAAFLLGAGFPQLLFGPMSDRYGRRPVFFAGLATFVAGSILSAAAPGFYLLLAARLLQGFGAGALRVVTFSIIRDRYSGTHMARIMSLAMTVVLLEPIVAPMIGQAILLVASWRWIVAVMAVVGCAMLAWSFVRLEESLPATQRQSISPRAVAGAYWTVLTTPAALGGMVVFGLLMGAHLGFLSSAQGIFQGIFDAGLRFTLFLALVSLAMSAAAFINSLLLRRFAAPLLVRCGFIALAAVNSVALAVAVADGLSLALFLVIQSFNMFAFGLLTPNLTVMAINPLGRIAGTASAVFGCVSITIGALAGFGVGQLFDGTIRPLACAYVLVSVGALLILSRCGPERG